MLPERRGRYENEDKRCDPRNGQELSVVSFCVHDLSFSRLLKNRGIDLAAGMSSYAWHVRLSDGCRTYVV